MATRAETMAILARMVMDADALRDAANLADDVPVDEYLEVKKLRRAVRDLYYRMSR